MANPSEADALRAELERLNAAWTAASVRALSEQERAERAEAENTRLRLQLEGMTGERDSEREIAQGWERKAEAAVAANTPLRAEAERLTGPAPASDNRPIRKPDPEHTCTHECEHAAR